MNTAPKLQEQHITTLHEMLDTHLNEPQSKEAKALKAAIAALAPPSGDGDQFKLIQQALFALWQSPNDYAARATAQTWLRPEDLAAYRATPQSAPVDVETRPIYWMGEEVKTTARLIEIVKEQCSAAIDYVLADDTTPPPASQERGGDWYTDEATGSHVVDWDYDPERQLSIMLKPDGRVAYAVHVAGNGLHGPDAMSPEFVRAVSEWSASPPSSAAEAVGTASEKEMTAAELMADFIAAQKPVPADIQAVISKQWPKYADAAEQAKPDDNMQLRARVAGELIAARDTEDGCNRIMALIATLDTYTAQTECVAAMYPAEQAQAGELDVSEAMMAADGAVRADEFDRWYASTGAKHWNNWDACKAAWNASRRLAGGVTVDDDMVMRAIEAHEAFVGPTNHGQRMRAALVAALSGGKNG